MKGSVAGATVAGLGAAAIGVAIYFSTRSKQGEAEGGNGGGNGNGETPPVEYICPYCGQAFTNEEKLMQHVFDEHETPGNGGDGGNGGGGNGDNGGNGGDGGNGNLYWPIIGEEPQNLQRLELWPQEYSNHTRWYLNEVIKVGNQQYRLRHQHVPQAFYPSGMAEIVSLGDKDGPTKPTYVVYGLPSSWSRGAAGFNLYQIIVTVSAEKGPISSRYIMPVDWQAGTGKFSRRAGPTGQEYWGIDTSGIPWSSQGTYEWRHYPVSVELWHGVYRDTDGGKDYMNDIRRLVREVQNGKADPPANWTDEMTAVVLETWGGHSKGAAMWLAAMYKGETTLLAQSEFTGEFHVHGPRGSSPPQGD